MALRMSERITANHTIPLLQSAITEALTTAVAIRREMRTKALQGCKSNIIRITLQGRSLLCPTLFHPEAVAQAEECARNAPPPPPVLHVNIDGDRLRAQPSSSGKPLHGGGPRFPANRGRGSGPHVSEAGDKNPHRGSASGFRGTRKAPPEKAPFFSYSGEASTSYAPEDQSSHRRPSRRLPSPLRAREGPVSREETLPEVTPLYLCVCAPLSSMVLRVSHGPAGHPQGPNLEMGQQTPSAVVATTLNLQGKVDPPHLQAAGRGDHRRRYPYRGVTHLTSSPFPKRPTQGEKEWS